MRSSLILLLSAAFLLTGALIGCKSDGGSKASIKTTGYAGARQAGVENSKEDESKIDQDKVDQANANQDSNRESKKDETEESDQAAIVSRMKIKNILNRSSSDESTEPLTMKVVLIKNAGAANLAKVLESETEANLILIDSSEVSMVQGTVDETDGKIIENNILLQGGSLPKLDLESLQSIAELNMEFIHKVEINGNKSTVQASFGDSVAPIELTCVSADEWGSSARTKSGAVNKLSLLRGPIREESEGYSLRLSPGSTILMRWGDQQRRAEAGEDIILFSMYHCPKE